MTDAARPAILVVDDDVNLVRAYERLLEGRGYAVDMAFDGEAAIRLLQDKQFDVVLTDINMPGVNGIEILRTVHALDQDVPVVFMTGFPGFESAQSAVEHGAMKYLVKPIPTADLLDVLAQAVRAHEAARRKRP